MKRVTRNVYVETEFNGCNVGFVKTNEGTIMIDTPMRPSQAVRWREEVQKTGPIRYLINTEHHIDHILGNYFFSALVISQDGTRQKFIQSLPKEQVSSRVREFGEDELTLVKDYEPRLPSITFEDRMKIYSGEHCLELCHLPGHTANETAVIIPRERVAFVSDNLFNNTMPWLHESLPFSWLRSIKAIKELDVDVIVPGHGDVCDRNSFSILEKFIREVIDTVQDVIERGLSKEEAVRKISFIDRFPIPEEHKKRAPMVQQMNIGRVYDVLKSGEDRPLPKS